MLRRLTHVLIAFILALAAMRLERTLDRRQ
jgi:hypothetical protein